MPLLRTSAEAASDLAVSRTFFDQHFAPVLPVVDLAPPQAKQRMPRYAVTDLQALITSRRQERV